MLDIKFVRENPEVVKENIRKKFQDQKLPLVDDWNWIKKTERSNRKLKLCVQKETNCPNRSAV